MKVLVTGSAGFTNGYVVHELLRAGHRVVGIDNFSKYGRVKKSYDDHPNYSCVRGDVKDVDLLCRLVEGCDQMVASAARIGGISYFHEYAYDLIAENERITAAHFDAALYGFKKGTLKKINVISSSMVFENATVFPTPESHIFECPPPTSTYGFQKLACEYFARGAFEQYGLPYTIIRPFNCVGTGEQRALGGCEIPSGNVKLAMSHVVPDLIQKVARGQHPLHILGDGSQVRHYTYGGDLARGIRICMEHPSALNEDFNLSTTERTTVLELARAIWGKMRSGTPFEYVSDDPFQHDVQLRTPDVRKAERILGFRATTSLDTMLDEVIPWITNAVAAGTI
ncbi:MAG: NAD(P)-dependent oxidoreductase [Chloroflexi bacterium]|nr:NAD(P)-dependent oxidoreductase [Chloroflexota bacterium]